MAVSPEDAANGPVGITIKLNGEAIPDTTLVVSVHITKDIGRIPEAVVTIQADGGEIENFDALGSTAFQISSDIEITGFFGDGRFDPIFDGIVVNTRLRLDSQSGLTMELFCRDKALALTGVRKSIKYDEKKDSDVIQQVIQGVGLTADVTATTRQWDQLRVDTSDWDFLRLLADRNGMIVNVEAGTVAVKAPDLAAAAVLTVTLGDDVLSYDAVIDAQRMIAKSDHVAWDSATQKIITGSDDQLSNPTLGDTSANDIAGVLGDRETYAPIGAETDSAALKALSKARLLRAGLDAVNGTCTFTGTDLINPGAMIEIKSASPRFSGTGFVSGVSHAIELGTWTTTARMGLPMDWVSDTASFGAAAGGGVSTPVPGLQIGIVTKRTEDPNNNERIQIRLPLFDEDGSTLVWARLGTSYATNGAGFQFLPEIGDEVLVGFINDDPNEAMIMGSLHSTKNPRAVEATEDNFIKTIITPEEIKIEFDDEKKVLTLSTPGGHSVVLDDDQAIIKLEDSNGNSIELGESGITLDSASDITLTAGGKIDVTASGDATVTGMNVTCDGSSAFTGKGGGSAEVSAGGNTTIKGAMVMIN